MESTDTQGGDNGRGAGVGGGSESGEGSGAGVRGGGSDEGEGASGNSSPPSVPGNSPSPVDTGTQCYVPHPFIEEFFVLKEIDQNA